MQVQVIVDREAAIKAGSDVYGTVVTELDLATLNEEDRAIVAAAKERDGVTDLTGDPWHLAGRVDLPRPKTATPDPLAWISWRRKMTAAEERLISDRVQEMETQFTAYLAWAREQPLTAFIRWDPRRQTGVASLPMTFGEMRLPEYRAEVPLSRRTFDPSAKAREVLAERLNEAQAEIDRRRELRLAQEAAREKENAEAAILRQERLAAEVENMDANAQGRWRMGLLPEEEILDSLRQRRYAALDGWPRYVKLRGADLDHKDWCEGREMDCAVEPAESLNAAQYDYFERFSRDLPAGAAYSLKVHTCVCETCGADASRYSILVRIEDGPLVFTREYALLAEADAAPAETPDADDLG